VLEKPGDGHSQRGTLNRPHSGQEERALKLDGDVKRRMKGEREDYDGKKVAGAIARVQ